MRVTKRLVAVAAATATMAAMLAIPTSPAGATSTVTSVRITGVDREATSVAIAAGAVTAQPTHVVLANSRSYADSVTASALAGKIDGTIILLPADGSLSAAAKAQLATATDVYIVGGPSVVPATVEAAVQAATTGSTTFTRLGGATRFETMKLVADNITDANVANLANKPTVLLANSANFADAVSASPAAYAGDSNGKVHPVLITPADSLAAETKAAITSLKATQVVILGGTAAVSAAVEAEIDAMIGVSVIRVAGADRYATADEFAKVLLTPKASGGFGWNAANVGLANLAADGDGADALAASAYLGQGQAPMLGTNNGVLPATTTAFLDTNKAAVATLHIFGGIAAVSAEVVTAAETAAGKLASPTAAITAAEKSTVATVVFSEKVTKASAETAGNYQLLGANGAVFTNGLAATMTDAGTTTSGTTVALSFTSGAPMVTGVTIQVLSAAISTADGRTVAAASTVITKDATAPTATLTAVIGTAPASSGVANEFKVSFSEPVTSALVAADFTLAGVAMTTITPSDYTLGAGAGSATLYTGVTITITGSVMGQAQTLAIKAAAVTDPAGNGNTAASTLVAADAARPTLTSATLAVTNTATAQVVTGVSGLLFQAKTAGVAGNAVAVDFLAESTGTAATTVSVAVVSGVTKITVTPAASATREQVAASIAANAQANALVKSTVLLSGDPGTGTSGFVGELGPLTGGASTATVTSTFSEDVKAPVPASISYDANAAGNAPGAVTAATGTAVATGNVVVSTHALTSATELPVLNVANVALTAGAVVDNGGNQIAAVTRNF